MLSVAEEITTPDTPSDLRQSDLRQVGAHPNHWYPVAWSREVKLGKTFAASFGGEPIVLIRPQDPGRPLRTSAGAAVEGRRSWLHRALLLPRLELRCIGPVRRCSLSWKS
jgi:hypothetical protein